MMTFANSPMQSARCHLNDATRSDVRLSQPYRRSVEAEEWPVGFWLHVQRRGNGPFAAPDRDRKTRAARQEAARGDGYLLPVLRRLTDEGGAMKPLATHECELILRIAERALDVLSVSADERPLARPATALVI